MYIFEFYISPVFDVQTVKSDDLKKLYRARRVVRKRGFAVSRIYNEHMQTIRNPYHKLSRPSFEKWATLESTWIDMYHAKWPEMTPNNFGYNMIRSMTSAACEFYAD